MNHSKEESPQPTNNLPIPTDYNTEPYHKGINVEDIIQLGVENPNLTATQAARILNIDRCTLYYHLNKQNMTWTEITRRHNRFKSNKAEILAYKQSITLDNITTDKLQNSSARDLAVTFGILHDHERKVLGLDTQQGNNNNVQVNINFDPALIPGGSGALVATAAETIEDKPEDE